MRLRFLSEFSKLNVHLMLTEDLLSIEVLGMLLIQAHYCLEPAAILESPQLNRVKLLAVRTNYDSKGVYTMCIDVPNGW